MEGSDSERGRSSHEEEPGDEDYEDYEGEEDDDLAVDDLVDNFDDGDALALLQDLVASGSQLSAQHAEIVAQLAQVSYSTYSGAFLFLRFFLSDCFLFIRHICVSLGSDYADASGRDTLQLAGRRR